ncbi:MAG: beta-propeller fold lactonase family protein [Bacteroidetes bacterium]|nr:beta-propeller fold lactonase family protein [Bacteroidota bacterium]
MKRSYKLLLIFGVLISLGLVAHFPGRKLARAHVNSKTAVDDHPLLCISCHLYTSKNKLVSKLINADYYSPFNMAVSKNGSLLYVVAQESNDLLVVDTENRKVLNKIKVGQYPHSVVLDDGCKMAYVSNQWSDNVSVIDLAASKVVDTLKTGNGPAGLSLSADGRFLYVVNSFSSNISVFDLSTGEERKRFNAGNNPTGTQLSPDGKTLYVTSRRALIAPYGETLRSELTVVDESRQRISERRNIESAYMMENVAFTPTGDMALVTMIRPKNLVPSIQVEQGWMMTYGIGIIEQKENGRVIQLLLDEPNAYYSDPFDIVISPDGKKAFVSNSGVNCISVVNIDSIRSLIAEASPEMLSTWSNHLGISSRYVIKRIYTGADPKGLALSPDGKFLYVAEQLEDRIAVINTESLNTINTIDLGGPRRITVARHGRRLFNNSGHTFQNQFACYTCHPDMHEDGLVYNMASKDMGRNLTNTQSLRDIRDTPPFKWNGKNQTVYKQDGMRFSTVLTRTEQFSYKDLDAITVYILTGIQYPPNLQYNPDGVLTESQLRGKAIFERTKDNSGKIIPENNRCITCHTPPYYTNLKLASVGTLAISDDSIQFDTPHLNNIYASPPYLHDGRAATLEEIWTLYGKEDKHGLANDMTKNQLNDLVEYLKSLRAPVYEQNTSKINHASFKSN